MSETRVSGNGKESLKSSEEMSAIWSWPVRESPNENVKRILPRGAGGANVRLWPNPAVLVWPRQCPDLAES
jgi:hypothetical protein